MVGLFDQFRDPLLRYLSGFGLPLPDGEEVLQEVFLSLFQHLDRGKSQRQYSWLAVPVAHNLALKRRYRTFRDIEARAEAASGVRHRPGAQSRRSDGEQPDATASAGAWSKRCRNRTAGVLFCGPRACGIGRLREFSICPSAPSPFPWPDPWRASRVPQDVEFMKYDEHLPDQQLLLDVEGELSSHDEKRVRAHLAGCWKCRARRQELENAITGFVRIHHREFEAKLPPAAGPRALLKAQLAQLSATADGYLRVYVSSGARLDGRSRRFAGSRSVPRSRDEGDRRSNPDRLDSEFLRSRLAPPYW